MRIVLMRCLAAMPLLLLGCHEFHDFEPTGPSQVKETPPAPPGAPGYSHEPYAGKPKYLAEARPLYPTNQPQPQATAANPCQKRSRTCDDRLRAVLVSIDGQILALQSPPTDVQLQALRLSLIELTPLLTPYPDMAAERDELGELVEKLPRQSLIDQGATRKRMTELTDLIRVQLAAAQ
jgi:hypothetical protein